MGDISSGAIECFSKEPLRVVIKTLYVYKLNFVVRSYFLTESRVHISVKHKKKQYDGYSINTSHNMNSSCNNYAYDKKYSKKHLKTLPGSYHSRLKPLINT